MTFDHAAFGHIDRGRSFFRSRQPTVDTRAGGTT